MPGEEASSIERHPVRVAEAVNGRKPVSVTMPWQEVRKYH